MDPGIHVSSTPGPGSQLGAQKLRCPLKKQTPLASLVWDTYQKQILLIPTDNDCFVVE